MRELALNILDIADNSVKADASLIIIEITAENNLLDITITDDGCGMNPEMLKRVTDPYMTSRTTRKVGLGIPLFNQAAEAAGGSFEIKSEEGRGTIVKAVFQIDNIDREPLGSVSDTIAALLSDKYDLVLEVSVNKKAFSFDTRELKSALENTDIENPEIISAVKQMITENIIEIGGDRL